MKLQRAAMMISMAISCGFILFSGTAFAKEEAVRVDYNFHDWGDLDVLIAKDRLRIEDKLRAWVIIVGRPDWKITCYSPARKTIASVPYDGFKMALGERLGVMTAGDVDPSHWKRIGPAVVNGINVIRYDQIIDLSSKRVPTAQIYISTDKTTNPKIVQFVSKFFDLPDLKSIPVRSTKRKIEKLKLDTRSMKHVAVKETDFAIPKGYKNKTFEEVLFTQTSFDY